MEGSDLLESANFPQMLTEAQELRQVRLPGNGAPPEEFYTTLLMVRAKQDRLEELLRNAMDWHRRAQHLARKAEEAAQDAWDQAAERERRMGAQSGRDYEGAQERYARWNVQVLEERRRARAYARAEQAAKSAVDLLRLMYQGLDGVRRDIHRILSYFPLESNLER